ncbi:hypothetical protein SEA_PIPERSANSNOM_2 [Microbacterium phage PiperSansNom]|uniref:Uncharacterized protein n=1 Tax=Microbacterium phage PiperSansNom TaxID=2590937 RepID=A0A516KUN3_9CAUD|nr:hypothetical protein SEA_PIPERSANSNOM_2 [Microbacterium phage PiperSansNom]
MSGSTEGSIMSMWCNRCPASIQNVSVAEALSWNTTHEATCTAPPSAPGPREWGPQDEVRMGA